MKYVKVNLQALALVNGLIRKLHTFSVEVPYSQEALAWAQQQGCGEIEVYERQEASPEPTRMDKLEAQCAYTAMMTDTMVEV